MSARKSQGGNALPETAFTISTVMLVFLGVIRLAMIGYQQSEADGASFVAAHAASLRDSDPVAQKLDGEAHAKADFSRTTALNVTPGIVKTGPYDNGVAIGGTDVLAQSLFGPSFVDLHSQVQEPVVGTPQSPPNIAFPKSTLVNCIDANPATPECDTNAYLARPDPNNTTDPYAMYDCHAKYYAALATGTNGSARGTSPWPDTYRDTTPGSINDPAVRQGGVYLNPDGTFGTALRPIANFGTSADPCAPVPPPAPPPCAPNNRNKLKC
ncbi:MAG: hypothetical protein NVSMB5_08320 [Candidatus Velthaea sp.]